MKARQVISMFGSPSALARAIGASREAVKKWSQRDSIPGEYDIAIVDAAAAAGLAITLADLARGRSVTPTPSEAAA